ncbi:MAG TPA: alpha-L-fucosidase [Sedimentisphaerales bacterium]|nr:alpha-L-fucosidase [Sedimentisphaerales bacterium]
MFKAQYTLLLALIFASTIPASASIKRAWLSKYASYEIIGESKKEPLPGFLTAAGEFYSNQKEDAYAISIAPGKDVGVIIDLGTEDKITSVVIKNRGNQTNQVGLKISISKDKKTWESDATWITEGEAYGWNISINKPGRYIKITKDADHPLELKWVKILMGGFYNGEELARLRYDGLPVKPAEVRPVPSWMKDGTGMGLFIHWGLNGWALLGGKAAHDKLVAEWPKTFTAKDYDPDKWMAAARRGGFAYSVLTTRHHAGFMLWPSKTEEVGGWGVKQYLGGRDLLDPWVKACRKNDLAVGFYFSPINWMWNSEEFPYRNFPKLKDEWQRGGTFVDMTKEELQPILDKWLEQDVFPCMEELLTRYGKVDYAWFDGFNWPRVGLDFHHDEAKALLLRHQPEILLNPRYNNWGEEPKFGDLGTAENHFPTLRPSGPWEFCWCMRGGWFAGGKGPDTGRGTPAVKVLANLAKCRSWDGYSLADIGPFPDGTMPDYFYGLCEVLGGWMDKNREALVGAQGGPWPEQVNVPVTTKDNGKTWYLFAWPQDEEGEFLAPDNGSMGNYDYKPKDKIVTVSNVSKEPSAVSILATGSTLGYEFKDKSLTFTIPGDQTTALLDVVKLEW